MLICITLTDWDSFISYNMKGVFSTLEFGINVFKQESQSL